MWKRGERSSLFNRFMKYFIKQVLKRIGLEPKIDQKLIKKFYYIASESLEKIILQDKKYQDLKKLNNYEYQIFSQGGEDGIITKIFKRIGQTNKYFVEIGVGGLESISTFLLLDSWSGLWLESNPKGVELFQNKFNKIINQGRLAIKEAFVTQENIQTFFKENQVPNEFDLLSIDIDGNDYWVWQAISSNYSPRVVVIEYNAALGPSLEWIMKYNPKHHWDKTAYVGASLKSLELLGAKNGYCLVGCNLAGINAFFVRQDLVNDKFLLPFTSENHYEPMRNYLLRKTGHQQTYKFFEE